jgi:hypothetical protein
MKRRNQILGLASFLLAVLGLVFVVYGAYAMFTHPIDYKQRWVEQHYVFRGKNPIDIFERVEAEKQNKPPPANGRDTRVDPDLGSTDGGYPPWSYFTGAALTFGPSFAFSRFFHGIVNLALLAGLVYWAYGLGKKEEARFGLFLAASLLAVNSICTTFFVGQYGVVVLAALVAAYLFDEKDNWWASGLCLGIAMVKVTLAGPFVLPFLIKMRWRVLVVAGVYLLVGSGVVAWAVHTNPLEMLHQMLTSSEHYQERGYSLNNVMELFHLDVQAAMKAAALVSLVAGMALLYVWRSSGLLIHFAITSVVARAWCYHALYDNLILVFLLLALGLAGWRAQSRLAMGSYVLLGISLWMPGRLTHLDVFAIAQWLIWVQALVVLLFLKRDEARLSIKRR